MLDPHQIKKNFPIFQRQIKGRPLVYLDNASTSQKPQVVIDTLKNYYENMNANIHRGLHELSEQSSEAYENCRQTVAKFINAKSEKEIIFTRNTTESINLIAYSWGENSIGEGDEIIVSELEHHSNLIPWQQLVKHKKAKLKIIPLKNDYSLDLDIYQNLLTSKTKLIAITGMSNVLGTGPDLKKIINLAHKTTAKVLIDGAQSVAHLPTNVQKLNCDFLAFSGHKMLGPTGVGILYCKEEILQNMPPFLTGGGMVKEVGQFDTTFADIPTRFEAGTPDISNVIAFEQAIKYLEKITMPSIAAHEKKLAKYTIEKFSQYPEVTILNPSNQSGIISFTLKGIHPHDIAQIFNESAVAIRAGHHCCQPLMKKLNLSATARISLYLYNTEQDIDQAEKALKNTIKIFA